MTREEKMEMIRTAAKERIPSIRNLILGGATLKTIDDDNYKWCYGYILGGFKALEKAVKEGGDVQITNYSADKILAVYHENNQSFDSVNSIPVKKENSSSENKTEICATNTEDCKSAATIDISENSNGVPAEDFFLCNVVDGNGTEIQYKVGC